MNDKKQSSTARVKWLLALCILLPLVLMAGKWPALPSSDFLRHWLSLAELPASLADRVQYVLFVPLAAAMVVLFRLTLGIRLLGPFRSILIAVAFQITGIVSGLVFLVVVIGILVACRPLIKSLSLPYFARISLMLSAIALLMVAAIFLCEWLGVPLLERVAYFPIVVICLTAEGFAQALAKEGFASALWRGTMTAVVAALITLAASISALSKLLMRYPELLLVQIGLIMIIAQYFDWRLLEKLNPPAKVPKNAKRTKSASKKAEPSALPDALEEEEKGKP